jgi:hypothetical protein
VVDGLVVKVLSGNDLLDNLLLDLLAELLSGDSLAVLGRDDDGVDAEGHNSTAFMGILDGDLGLGVRAEPRKAAVVTGLLHGGVESVREKEGQRQELRGLVGSISKHDALVTGTKILESLIVVQTLGDIRRLLLDGDENVAGLVVEALVGRVVSNVLDRTADDLLVVETGLGGDFAKDHDHAGLGSRLAGHLGERVFPEAGIEDSVGDLVAGGNVGRYSIAHVDTGHLRDLVRVALADRLGGEEEGVPLERC